MKVINKKREKPVGIKHISLILNSGFQKGTIRARPKFLNWVLDYYDFSYPGRRKGPFILPLLKVLGQ